MLLLDWNIMIINSALHQLRKNEWPGFLILGMELLQLCICQIMVIGKH